MIIISRGWGKMALLIPIVFQLLGVMIFGVKGNTSLLVVLYCLLASGPVVFVVGRWLNRRALQAVAVLRQPLPPEAWHSMYGMRMEYWGILYMIIASALLVYQWLK